MKNKTIKLFIGIAIIASILLCVKLLYGGPQESPLSEEETTVKNNQHYTAKEVTGNPILLAQSTWGGLILLKGPLWLGG